jgi:hypothetical protein
MVAVWPNPSALVTWISKAILSPYLLVAVRAALADGGSSSEIGDRLLANGFGTGSGGRHSPTAISRFRQAVAYLGDDPYR